MRRFQGYIFDLDGTIYLGERAIPGAPETVRCLRQAGCRVTFVSNKPLEPRERYAEKLTRLGIPTDPADVLTSGHVLGHWLAAEAPGARVFVVGEPPLLAELAAFGLHVTNDAQHTEEADFVVAAFDRAFDYRKLNTAFQAIRQGARFVATAGRPAPADRTRPVEGGEIPDVAPPSSAPSGAARAKRWSWWPANCRPSSSRLGWRVWVACPQSSAWSSATAWRPMWSCPSGRGQLRPSSSPERESREPRIGNPRLKLKSALRR